MNSKSEEYIPLFLHLNESNVCYIIDNHIIFFRDHPYTAVCPYKSWNYLLDFYNKLSEREFIPKELENYFQAMEPIKLDFLADWFYGTFDHFNPRNYSLNADLSLNKTTDEILLSNFQIMNREDDVYTFDYSIQLSLKDAFYNLSNLCVSSRSMNFTFLNKIKLDSFITDVREQPDFQKDLQSSPKNICKAELYILSYLDYIKKILTQNLVSPDMLLSKSGAFVLSLLADLPVVTKFIEDILTDPIWQIDTDNPRKAMLFTFLNLIDSRVAISSKVKEFLSSIDTFSYGIID